MAGSKIPRKLQFTAEGGAAARLVGAQVKCRVRGVFCQKVFPNVFVSSPHLKIGSVCTLLNLPSRGSGWKSPCSPSSPLPSHPCWRWRDAYGPGGHGPGSFQTHQAGCAPQCLQVHDATRRGWSRPWGGPAWVWLSWIILPLCSASLTCNMLVTCFWGLFMLKFAWKRKEKRNTA